MCKIMDIFRRFFIFPLALLALPSFAASDAGLLANPVFWLGVAFVIFLIIALKPIVKIIVSVLDARVQEVEDRMQEAIKLKEEALEMRAQAERMQHEAIEEAKRLIAYAQKDAELIQSQGLEALQKTIDKKQAAVKQRIQMMEERALAALRHQTADISGKALARLIDENFTDSDDDALIETTIAKLPELMKQSQN